LLDRDSTSVDRSKAATSGRLKTGHHRSIRARHEEQARRRVAQVVETQRAHVRHGPKLAPIHWAAPKASIWRSFPVSAALAAATVLVAGGDASSAQTTAEDAFQRYVGSHHPTRPRALLLVCASSRAEVREYELAGTLTDGFVEPRQRPGGDRNGVSVAAFGAFAALRAGNGKETMLSVHILLSEAQQLAPAKAGIDGHSE
jgi:hypothetical protein